MGLVLEFDPNGRGLDLTVQNYTFIIIVVISTYSLWTEYVFEGIPADVDSEYLGIGSKEIIRDAF